MENSECRPAFSSGQFWCNFVVSVSSPAVSVIVNGLHKFKVQTPFERLVNCDRIACCDLFHLIALLVFTLYPVCSDTVRE